MKEHHKNTWLLWESILQLLKKLLSTPYSYWSCRFVDTWALESLNVLLREEALKKENIIIKMAQIIWIHLGNELIFANKVNLQTWNVTKNCICNCICFSNSSKKYYSKGFCSHHSIWWQCCLTLRNTYVR